MEFWGYDMYMYGEMFARQTQYKVQLGIIEEIKMADRPFLTLVSTHFHPLKLLPQ